MQECILELDTPEHTGQNILVSSCSFLLDLVAGITRSGIALPNVLDRIQPISDVYLNNSDTIASSDSTLPCAQAAWYVSCGRSASSSASSC